ncbi:MAG: DUF4355 domain-containing protein [Clostridiales Family XIII bacterium]|jgi:hypothetical protein|nr:DUF4355 domain-containing protein [Clostridiales Family XIII bacterium]
MEKQENITTPTPADVKEKVESKGFNPITSQEQFESALKPRLEREKTKYADYPELKKKADEYDKIVEQNKSEQQKQAERLAKLEQELKNKDLELLRTKLIKNSTLTADVSDLITGVDEQSIKAQIEKLETIQNSNKSVSIETEKNSSSVPKNNNITDLEKSIESFKRNKQGVNN